MQCIAQKKEQLMSKWNISETLKIEKQVGLCILIRSYSLNHISFLCK